MLPSPRERRHLTVVALGRHTAPVTVRERLARADIDWSGHLRGAVPGLVEWAILTTCHRFELYLVANEPHAAKRAIGLLASLGGCNAPASAMAALGVDELEPGGHGYFTIYAEEAAAHHLCHVAAGADSAILGEPQIQGQVAQAYAAGLEQGNIGPVLAALFRAALRAGKRARSETAISARSANLSSVALNLAAEWVGGLNVAQVVVIGAGEMSKLALKALRARGARRVVVVNRTQANAQAALLDPHWRAVALADLETTLMGADIVFSATRAEGYMVTRAHVARMLAARQAAGAAGGPALIDLAVPRDVDPAVRGLPGVLLVDVDDLQETLDQTRRERAQALPQVEAIIAEELAQHRLEMAELAVRPVVAELRQKAERIRTQEVERTLRFLGAVDEETREHIEHLSRALVNKLLHAPTVRLKELARSADVAQVADTVRDLFALERGDNGHVPYSPIDHADQDAPAYDDAIR